MRGLKVPEAHLVHLPYVYSVHIAEAIECAIVEEVQWRFGEGEMVHGVLVELAPAPG